MTFPFWGFYEQSPGPKGPKFSSTGRRLVVNGILYFKRDLFRDIRGDFSIFRYKTNFWSLTSNHLKMWICPLCSQEFVNTNQVHSCNDKVLADFLAGKSQHTLELFNHLVNEYKLIGDVRQHPAKSMISFAARTRFAYIIQLGKNFIDVVFPFKEPYNDNLCFNKIKPVPGSDDYNHHFRMFFKEDINDEVKMYMRMAYDIGS